MCLVVLCVGVGVFGMLVQHGAYRAGVDLILVCVVRPDISMLVCVARPDISMVQHGAYRAGVDDGAFRLLLATYYFDTQ